MENVPPERDNGYRKRLRQSQRLLAACGAGKTRRALRALAAGADSNFRHPTLGNPAWAAARSNHTEILEMLATRAALLEIPGPDGLTPLQTAAALGHLRTVEILPRLGADPLASPGGKPLRSAFALSAKLAAPDCLLACLAARQPAQADLAAAGFASLGSRSEANLRILLDAGLDPNATSPDGNHLYPHTLLSRNADRMGPGATERNELLLHRGANPNLPAERGAAWHIASSKAFVNKPTIFKGESPILEALLRHGLDPLGSTPNGKSLAFSCAHFGWAEGFLAALNHGDTPWTADPKNSAFAASLKSFGTRKLMFEFIRERCGPAEGFEFADVDGQPPHVFAALYERARLSISTPNPDSEQPSRPKSL